MNKIVFFIACAMLYVVNVHAENDEKYLISDSFISGAKYVDGNLTITDSSLAYRSSNESLTWNGESINFWGNITLSQSAQIDVKVSGAAKVYFAAKSTTSNAERSILIGGTPIADEKFVSTQIRMIGYEYDGAAATLSFEPDNGLYLYMIYVDYPSYTSVGSEMAGKEIVRTEYYSICGSKLTAAPTTGVYLTRTFFADGSVKTQKIMKR